MTTVNEFINERKEIYPLPEGPVEQITLLAEELVLGVHFGFWLPTLYAMQSNTIGGEYVPIEEQLQLYLQRRWGDIHIGHKKRLLKGHGYLDDLRDTSDKPFTRLSREAFALLSKAPPYIVFVSYKHAESSAFALLVVVRLKEFGLKAYCDMRLAPGDPWHPELENQVKASKFVVLLLGPTTLCSDAVTDEIEWAIDSGATVIPITHNGFNYQRKDWDGKVPDAILDTIEHNHRIPIPREHENAAGYDIAIRTLLVNRFGVTL